jgi:hypothetical protein
MTQQLRSRCRNQRCRTKLEAPTDNHHKAFCTPYCFDQFYHWKCKVCEKPIQRGRRGKQPDHCHDHRCRRDFRRFPESFTYPNSVTRNAAEGHGGLTVNYGSRSAHFTGLKSALAASFRGYRIIAGPALSPPERVSEAEWRARDAADARHVAEDERRLRAEAAHQ